MRLICLPSASASPIFFLTTAAFSCRIDMLTEKLLYRSVAQLGRALRSGRRGRGFESRRFDSWQGQSRNCMNMRFRDFSFSKTRRLQSAAPEGYPPHKAEDVLSWYWTERYKPEHHCVYYAFTSKISKRKIPAVRHSIRKDPYFVRKSFTAQEENRRKIP